MDCGIRLQKIIAMFGSYSRRQAELLIANRMVMCNGVVSKLGDRARLNDEIVVSGKLLKINVNRSKKYVILNKPRGYLTATFDGRGRRCVTDLLFGFSERLFPVGRLDLNSEGLLILTNDGFLANRLMHPSSCLKKTYRVTLNKPLTADIISQISRGLQLGRYVTSSAEVAVVFQDEVRTVVEISIHEGKNRQIRRTMEHFNIGVKRLKRISIGPVKLGMLKPGGFRELTFNEVKELKSSVAI